MTARWAAHLAQDLRAALRHIRRAPTVSAIVVLTLALSIGAATAAYAVVHRLLLAPLPYDDGNRIVSLEMRKIGDGNFMWTIDASLYRLFAVRSRTLDDFSAYNWDHAAAGTAPTPDTLTAAEITPSFFPMLRVHPSLGRAFMDADARPNAPLTAILGDSLWQAQFAGNPNALGRTITVNGKVREIIGVVPRRVILPADRSPVPDLWLTLDVTGHQVQAVARLRSGASSATAAQELGGIRRNLPDTGDIKGWHAETRSSEIRVAPS